MTTETNPQPSIEAALATAVRMGRASVIVPNLELIAKRGSIHGQRRQRGVFGKLRSWMGLR